MNQTSAWATLALALIWMAGSPAKGQTGVLQWRYWVDQDPMTDERYHQTITYQPIPDHHHERKPALLFTCAESPKRPRPPTFTAFFGGVVSTIRQPIEGHIRVDKNRATPFRGEAVGKSFNPESSYAVYIDPIPPGLISQMKNGSQIQVRIRDIKGLPQDSKFSLIGFARAFNKLLAGCPLMRTP